MNVDDYLRRLKCENNREVSLENLKRLQKRHFEEFCFENLDMHMGKRIEYAPIEVTYDRLMNQSRGGYCLQLNTIFGWLLKQLGYNLFLTPCYIILANTGQYATKPIHVILVVSIDDRLYYVDVGTSRDLNEPIEICDGKIQTSLHGSFKFTQMEDDFFMLEKRLNGKDNWTVSLKFKLEPKELEYFKEMNEYVQTKEHASIYFRTIVVRHFENSLRYLIGYKYTELQFNKDGDIRTTSELNLEQVKVALKEKFNLNIDDSFVPVDKLDAYFESIKNSNL